jgi:nicotinamide-nucleotide amidase
MSEVEHPVVSAIGDFLNHHAMTLSVAESLTGGELSARFACAEGSSDWYRGAVVAYSSQVKHALLGVPNGPVVSAQAVEAMAEHVTRLFDAKVGLAVSGVAGPGPQDGQPPGAVWMAVHVDGRTQTRLEHFAGEPSDVVDSTLDGAPAWLLQILTVAI